MFSNWLNKMERRLGRFAISGLMLYISATILVVFLADFMLGMGLSGYLTLSRSAIFSGQVWRLVTFLFVPPTYSVISLLFTLYFYYLIGSGLEAQWGSFRFNVYYLFGMLGAILAAMITGYGSATYLNLSLFLAFAAIFPDFQIMLFFLFPIKIKYLAYLDWALFALSLVFALLSRDWATVAAIAFSLANYFLFFGGNIGRYFRNKRKYGAVRRNFRKEMKRNQNGYYR
ncbi:MAG: rhomboid family intramembrane serine protease [Oscillospiraceae bacterium]|nr:rhomboid family intramembrane serine protease [Oscillospiraceae bacterium]